MLQPGFVQSEVGKSVRRIEEKCVVRIALVQNVAPHKYNSSRDGKKNANQEPVQQQYAREPAIRIVYQCVVQMGVVRFEMAVLPMETRIISASIFQVPLYLFTG